MPNETVLIQWVIFMVAFLVLNFGVFQPVLRILNERRALTLGARDQAKSLDHHIQELTVQCEKKVEEARAVGNSQRMEIRRAGEKAAEELLKKTRAEVDQKLDEIRHKIDRESKGAAMQLRQYAQTISHEAASKILGREI